MPATKRIVDLGLSIALLPLVVPVSLIIAVLVKSVSGSPVLYRAPRAGLCGAPFSMLKFRTMVVDADRRGGWATQQHDPRVTPLGRWLRRTSLDELPQFWNVLCGEMSLVGPRPAPEAQLSLYDERTRRLRQTVRPGITGLTQVCGRSTLSQRQGATYDVWYATHHSLRLDAYILARTVAAVILQRNTN